MQGSLQALTDVFEGKDKCLVIPGYQRNYDWKKGNCARLFDDLLDVIENDRPNHFFGSIVYKVEGAIGEMTIIDGQQRLTTVNLLFLALHDCLTDGTLEPDDDLAEWIRDDFLNSKHAANGRKLKLKPVKADASTYEKLFLAGADLDESSNLTANYRYFAERLGRREVEPRQLFDAIRKLQVMRLQLEESDDAQLIFESLNSTGLDLTQADMIRNFVIMGQNQQDQEELYEQYWNPMEQDADYDSSEFIRHWLTTQLGRTPKKDRLYEEFRAYVRTAERPVRDILAQMRAHARHYRDLRKATVGEQRVDHLLCRFNLVDRTVTMPLLLPVMDAYRKGDFTADELLKVLTVIDSYLTRRWVCGLPTNALNKVFALVWREAVKKHKEGDSLSEIIVFLLASRQGTAIFPGDQMFGTALAEKDFYHISAAQRNYFWECLENGASKDTRDIAGALAAGDISVEHIMPQTLNSEWMESFGARAKHVHDTWLHRLGNLTVTGYNANYSNVSFAQKRDCEQGFRSSPYRINSMLRDLDAWGEDEMASRGAELSAIAMRRWPEPAVSYSLRPGARDVEPMGEEGVFTGRTIRGWEYDGVTYPVTAWRQMLTGVVSPLTRQDPAAVRRHAATTAKFRIRAPRSEPDDGYSEVAPGLDVSVWNSTEEKMAILRGLFHAMSLDADDLLFHLRPGGDSEEPGSDKDES
ncbi:DUF262 domain-containing protein [uncultured Propionibacterium sp.]|uniref:DUF262 domain-containing protein n=1 Tax=uncultured Propionibacterium sp. TaxID=218066 RepID=UPI00293161FE|nr:DUF262 domain-containing protein [uncultured Propionibacterium sp.]